MGTKNISELNIVELNRELTKRGIETGGTKVDKLLVLEEYIRTKERTEPGLLRFGVTDDESAQVTDTSEVQNETVDAENSLVNKFMEQILDRLEGLETTVDDQQRTITTLRESVERLERELAEEKRKSSERVVQASGTSRGDYPHPSSNHFSGANRNCPDQNDIRPVKTHQVSAEDRWANIRNRLSGGNSPNRILPEVSGNQSGVFGEKSGVSGNQSGVSGEMFGVSGNQSGMSGVSGEMPGARRVHFADSLLIPQYELNLARSSMPEFAGKKDEDPVRFLLQAEEILKETGINRARWVTVLAPQLKGKAGTWWGRLRSLELPWEQFKAELLQKFNGDELQSNLQSELLSTGQTRSETLEEFVLMKYQLYLRVNEGLSEQSVVKAVVGLMRSEFRVHARIQRPKSFDDLRTLSHVLDGCITVVPDKAGVSTSGPSKQKWWDKKKAVSAETPQVPSPSHRPRSGSGCRVCGSLDHWQAACPKKKSESGNAKTTGGTGKFRPVRK